MTPLRAWLASSLFLLGAAGGCTAALGASDDSLGMPNSEFASDGAPPAPRASSTLGADAATGASCEKGASPLCYKCFTCAPDDLTAAACQPLDAGAPATLPADAANVTSDASDSNSPDAYGHDSGLYACRVEHTGKGTAGQSPVCGAAGTGGDGDQCRASADCAAGFECIGDPGQCRRYCCLGAASCGADRFCDKRIVQGTENVLVPACVPIRTCELFGTGMKGCPANETCAIVDQTDGRTSCVAVGNAAVGDSCEIANCVAGAMCLGSEGSRTCFKLCSKSSPTDCPTNFKCKGTTPLFSDLDQGICVADTTQGTQKH